MKNRFLAIMAWSVLLSVSSIPGQSRESARIQKGPYLNRPLPDSMTVIWETDVPTTGNVEYGPAAALGLTAADKEVRRLHVVQLVGLQPSTKYYYRVRSAVPAPDTAAAAKSEIQSPPHSFSTAPADRQAAIRMVVYGDNQSWPPCHRRVVNLIAKQKPDLIVNTGDFIDSYGDYDEWQWMFFDQIQDLISEKPLYGARGNHDKKSDYFRQFLVPYNTNTWYAFDYGPVHGAVLDTALGNPTSEQLDWLEKDLATAQAPWKFLFLHRPLITPDNRFNKICSAQGVALVFFGHEHIYQRTRPINGVVYIINGGGGGNQMQVEWGDNRSWQSYTAARRIVFHAVVLDIDGQHVTLRAIDPDDHVFDTLELRQGQPPPGPSGVFLPEIVNLSAVERIPMDLKPGEATNILVAFTNPLPRPLTLRMKASDFSTKNWRVEPGEAEVTAQPGQAIKLSFRVTRLGPEIIPTAFLFGDLFYDGQKVGQSVRVIANAAHRTLRARRTPQAPVLDGKLTEACWTNADITSEFTLRSGHATVSQATRVSACHDADYLYLAFDCAEKKVREMYAYLPPGAIRTYNDDNIGVFFYFPGATEQPLMLIASCRGNSMAEGGVKGRRWQPTQRVGVDRRADGWCAELAIPLTNFPPGRVAAGDQWAVDFIRHRYPLPMELSSWACPYSEIWAWTNNLGLLNFTE